MTGGLLALSRINDGGSSIQYVLIPTLLTTLGISFSIVPSTIAATQAAAPERAGLASGRGEHLPAGRRRPRPGGADLDRHPVHE